MKRHAVQKLDFTLIATLARDLKVKNAACAWVTGCPVATTNAFYQISLEVRIVGHWKYMKNTMSVPRLLGIGLLFWNLWKLMPLRHTQLDTVCRLKIATALPLQHKTSPILRHHCGILATLWLTTNTEQYQEMCAFACDHSNFRSITEE